MISSWGLRVCGESGEGGEGLRFGETGCVGVGFEGQAMGMVGPNLCTNEPRDSKRRYELSSSQLACRKGIHLPNSSRPLQAALLVRNLLSGVGYMSYS